MYANHPTTAQIIRRQEMEELLAEAARERLARQCQPTGNRRAWITTTKHVLGTALVWIGAKLQGAHLPKPLLDHTPAIGITAG